MDGIVKTAQPEAPQEVKQVDPIGIVTYEWEGIPVDIIRFFNVDMTSVTEKETGRLRDIYDWAKEGEETIGDVLQKISRIVNPLGAPALG